MGRGCRRLSSTRSKSVSDCPLRDLRKRLVHFAHAVNGCTCGPSHFSAFFADAEQMLLAADEQLAVGHGGRRVHHFADAALAEQLELRAAA